MLSFLKTNLSPSSEVKETKSVEKTVEKVEEATETLEWKDLTFDIIRNIRDPGFLKVFLKYLFQIFEIWMTYYYDIQRMASEKAEVKGVQPPINKCLIYILI